ncbi:hypothetical protein [Kordia sp.]|uniref:hypothetical protein n=1 Tax=Kordia sp. TaxID=1965332 RepID=UPI003D6B0D6D
MKSNRKNRKRKNRRSLDLNKKSVSALNQEAVYGGVDTAISFRCHSRDYCITGKTVCEKEEL